MEALRATLSAELEVLNATFDDRNSIVINLQIIPTLTDKFTIVNTKKSFTELPRVLLEVKLNADTYPTHSPPTMTIKGFWDDKSYTIISRLNQMF